MTKRLTHWLRNRGEMPESPNRGEDLVVSVIDFDGAF
jgi:hypothetical protein